MIVLVIDDKPRIAHHRSDPAQAMIAVVAMVFQMIPEQEALGRAIRNVDAEHVGAAREDEATVGRLFRQRVTPVAHHAVEAFAQDQFPATPDGDAPAGSRHSTSCSLSGRTSGNASAIAALALLGALSRRRRTRSAP